MQRIWILRALKIGMFTVAAIAVLGYVVMSLWNWLLPPLTGWHALGFGQALGLLVLCRILFGGHGRRGGHWRHRLRERWASMPPEERERLRANFGRRCHGGAGSAAPPAG
jgi:hypothetical protein